MQNEKQHDRGIAERIERTSKSLSNQSGEVAHFFPANGSQIGFVAIAWPTRSILERVEVEDEETQDDDTGHDHAPRAHRLTAGSTGALVGVIPDGTGPTFSEPDLYADRGMSDKNENETCLDSPEQGSEADQEVGVFVVRCIARKHGQIADHVHQHEANEGQSGETGEQFFSDGGAQGAESTHICGGNRIDISVIMANSPSTPSVVGWKNDRTQGTSEQLSTLQKEPFSG